MNKKLATNWFIYKSIILNQHGFLGWAILVRYSNLFICRERSNAVSKWSGSVETRW